MEIIEHTLALPSHLRGGVLSIGKFDGVHCGHAQILRRLVSFARQKQVPSLVFTFSPTPAEIICPGHTPSFLGTKAQKIEWISEFSPSAILFYPTDRHLLELSANDFFYQIVMGQLQARGLIEGVNFYFGKNRSGNSTVLRHLCERNQLDFEIVPSLRIEENEVSSSRIRALIREGNVAQARQLLGRFYRIQGRVVHGDHRGRLLGFPTANLADVPTLLPKPGVYAARVFIQKTPYAAAVNLGGNPTFDVSELKFETHLLDFSGDLYGQPLQVDFLARIRDVIRFDSQEQLLRQMNDDQQRIREIFSTLSED